MGWRAIPLVGLISISLAAPPAPGQDEDLKVGRRVFTQYGTTLRIGDQVRTMLGQRWA